MSDTLHGLWYYGMGRCAVFWASADTCRNFIGSHRYARDNYPRDHLPEPP